MMNIIKKSGLLLTGVLFMACAGSPAPATVEAPARGKPADEPAVREIAQSKPADELDAAVRETSDYLNAHLAKGNKLVILNIQSAYPALSEYIIDELIANTVNDRVFTVVDRRQLDTIRAELDFQYSGEVDDDTMQALGRMAGAQIIVSGAVSKIGDLYRLRVRALGVQTARIEGQFNRNIPDGPTVAALSRSQATGYGDSAARPAAAASSKPAAAQGASAPAAKVATTPAAPAPAPAKVYKIGDTGPGGGIVFYAEGNSGMEVSRLLGSHTWEEAVKVAKEFNGGGMKDWYLPTRSELNLIYENLQKAKIANLGTVDYWSSSVIPYWEQAYMQHFRDGSYDERAQTSATYSVRAVRIF